MKPILLFLLSATIIAKSYASVPVNCLSKICDHLRTIEFATSYSLVENSELANLVEEIENFKNSYPNQDEHKKQLDLVFPRFKKYVQVKTRLDHCQEENEKLSPELVTRMLADILQVESQDSSCCTNCVDTIPLLPSAAEALDSSQTQEQKLIQETSQSAFNHAIGNLVDIEYRTNPQATITSVYQELIEEVCTRKTPCSEEYKQNIRSEIRQRWNNMVANQIPRYQNYKQIYNKIDSIISEVNGHFDKITGQLIYDPQKRTMGDTGTTFEVSDGAFSNYQKGIETLFEHTTKDVGLLILSPTLSRRTLRFIKPLHTDVDNYLDSFRPTQDIYTYNYQIDDVQTYDFHMSTIPSLRDKGKKDKIIKKAIKETKKAIRDNIKKTAKYDSDNFWEAITENPMAIAETLVADPSLASTICSHLIEASKREKRRKKTQNFLRFAGGVATAATIGLTVVTAGGAGGLAAATAVASGLLGGAANVAGAVMTHNHISDVRSALASGTGSQDNLEELPRLEKEFNSLVSQAVLDLGLTTLDVLALAKIMKTAGGMASFIDDFKTLMTRFKNIGPSLRNSFFKLRNKLGQTRFANFLKNLKNGASDPNNVKKAIMFLDDASPEQTRKFTQMLDDCACGV